MNKSEINGPVANDVLQSDHHVQMSQEEIAKAKAHHDKRHGDHPKDSGNSGAKMKNVPVKPR